MGCGNIFSKKEAEERGFENWPTKKSRQEYKVNGWQQESPAKEYLEQVRRCRDTDCNESMMKEKRLHRLEEWGMGRV